MPTHAFTHRRTLGSNKLAAHHTIDASSSNENAISESGRLLVPALADYLFSILFDPICLILCLYVLVAVVHSHEFMRWKLDSFNYLSPTFSFVNDDVTLKYFLRVLILLAPCFPT